MILLFPTIQPYPSTHNIMVAQLISQTVIGYGALEGDEERLEVFLAVDEEMDRQDATWGAGRVMPNELWMTILSEETGEVARDILEQNHDHLITELIQCNAVITQWIMALQKSRPDSAEASTLSSQDKDGSSILLQVT